MPPIDPTMEWEPKPWLAALPKADVHVIQKPECHVNPLGLLRLHIVENGADV